MKFVLTLALILCSVFYVSIIHHHAPVFADETGILNPDAPNLSVTVREADESNAISTVEIDMTDGLDTDSPATASYRAHVGETIQFRKQDFEDFTLKGIREGEETRIHYDGDTVPEDLHEPVFDVILVVRGSDETEKQVNIEVPATEVMNYEIDL